MSTPTLDELRKTVQECKFVGVLDTETSDQIISVIGRLQRLELALDEIRKGEDFDDLRDLTREELMAIADAALSGKEGDGV